MSNAEAEQGALTAEIDRIRGGMSGHQFFLMHRRHLAPYSDEILLEHYRWIIDVEKQGNMVLSGARFDRDGNQEPGMSVFRAESWEAAETLGASDPFVIKGVVSFFIERWRIGGGRLTLSIDLSDQTSRLV